MSARVSLLALPAAFAAASALATEPTLEQLLAQPSPAEIVAKWKAVCLDHAGDEAAQRRAVVEQQIDWPYQAAFDDRGGKPACMVVSSTALDATGQALGDAIAAADGLALEDVRVRNRSFTASTVIDGAVFGVHAQVTPSQGIATAVVALVDMKERQP